jgi:hypothetical protein
MTVTLPSVSSVKSVVPNPAWASLPLFDRTGWKRVRFGDVVENCNETCDPAEAVRRSGRLLVRASGTHSSLVRKVVQ